MLSYSKTSARGHKGTYARSGGKINRGFEGGQAKLSQRLPKRGFRKNRFNTHEDLEYINLGKIAYSIQKGVLDPHETITMKHLFEAGVITKIRFGVKVLGGGQHKLAALSQAMGVPIRLEVSDATAQAVEAIKQTGGTISSVYRTPLIMRYYLKPHKYPDYVDLKTPMPSPKRLKRLELLREKGIEVSYPAAPWHTDHQEQLEAERLARLKRIAQAEHADLLPELPADRSEGVGLDRPRIQRKQLYQTFKYV